MMSTIRGGALAGRRHIADAHQTPLGAIARGLAAGVVGTALMTVAQELSARLPSSGDSQPQGDDSEQQGDLGSAPADPWEQASMPAQVARRISEGVFHHEVSPDKIPVLMHAMHWGYGTAWGAVYGMLQGTFGEGSVRQGIAFGAGVWAMSYVQLVPMGLNQPPWKYPAKDTALEIGYHLVYGAGVAAAHRRLAD